MPDVALLPMRLQAKIVVRDDGCWEWMGARGPKGHGVTWLNGGTEFAHRAVYFLLVDAVADGLDLHHRCEVPCCVNPDHLEPLGHGEHRRRHPLSGTAARNACATHCIWGHEFTDANTYRSPDGGRECRVCRAQQRRGYEDRTRRAHV